jgi:DMSO/TMAO reductase YedYZ molybdopterin-dependent catalytic subunit
LFIASICTVSAMPSRSPLTRWARYEPYRKGPMRDGAFDEHLHDDRTAAQLGIALGICFSICFATGLLSHGIQRGPDSLREAWPSTGISIYRITQGLHVLTGVAAIPLLAVKLWVVYPRLFSWPPARNLTHAIERLSLLALVGGAIFQLATGVMNVFYWYAFPFTFPNAHYAGAWIAIGGLVIHIGAKIVVARRALAAPAPAAVDGARLSRRGLLLAAAGGSGTLVLLTAGSTVSPISRLAVLAPRRAGVGPSGVPINHVATGEIRAAASSPDYRLTITGRVARPLSLTRADLAALPQASEELPISCVEGWSTNASWRGVRIRDLLDRAGAPPDAVVRVLSLQKSGGSSGSILYPDHHRDPRTLLALELNGDPLHADHGWPVRLIAPNRPGTQQTKWVDRIEVV